MAKRVERRLAQRRPRRQKYSYGHDRRKSKRNKDEDCRIEWREIEEHLLEVTSQRQSTRDADGDPGGRAAAGAGTAGWQPFAFSGVCLD